MDPRRILLRTDPGHPGTTDLILRIPGAREVIIIGEWSPELPGIQIITQTGGDPTKIAAQFKATLVIDHKETSIPVDHLLIPPQITADSRSITDHLLVWLPLRGPEKKRISTLLDQMSPHEVLLLTEGKRDPEIPLHAPQTIFSTQEIAGDAVDAIIRAASIMNPTLIIAPRRISSIDQEKILGNGVPLFIPHPGGGGSEIRELRSEEFSDANQVWFDYHETTGDPLTDRVFAALEGGEIVSLARCRRHPDGFEVDAVWTPKQHRGRGLARQVTGALVEACYNEELTMYSVQHLEKFYGEFGFVPIPERELPASVRARYLWAAGNLEGAEVLPMKRIPSRPPILTRVDTHK